MAKKAFNLSAADAFTQAADTAHEPATIEEPATLEAQEPPQVPTIRREAEAEAQGKLSIAIPGKRESKSRRLQLLMQPTVYDTLKANADEIGISMNSYINLILQAAADGDIQITIR